jgi:hypothetical protein
MQSRCAPEGPLLRGVLSLLLLELLAQRESYGYEVVQRLHTIGLIGVPEGAVYPALSRLERGPPDHAARRLHIRTRAEVLPAQ